MPVRHEMPCLRCQVPGQRHLAIFPLTWAVWNAIVMWIKVAVCFLETFYNPFIVNESLLSPIWRASANHADSKEVAQSSHSIVMLSLIWKPMNICHCTCALYILVPLAVSWPVSLKAESAAKELGMKKHKNFKVLHNRPRPADDLWNRAFDFAEDCWLLLAPRLALLFFLRIGPVEPVEPDELDITGWFYTATGYRHLNSNVARCRQDAKNLHKDSEVGVKTR